MKSTMKSNQRSDGPATEQLVVEQEVAKTMSSPRAGFPFSMTPDPRQKSPFIHSHALVETDHIGPGTRIWAFAHVMSGAVIGADCNICDYVYVDEDVVIGDRVTIKGGVMVIDGMRVEDDVFIGPHATFTNDRFPRSRQPFHCEAIVIEKGATIGAGAIFLPGVSVGEGAMVGAGAVVTKNVAPFTVVLGNPGRVVRAVTDAERIPAQKPSGSRPNGAVPSLAGAGFSPGVVSR